VRGAVASIAFDVDAVVIVSPHARATGVYRSLVGDLAAFGVPAIGIDMALDGGLRDALGPLIDGPIDHGIVVPLRLRDWLAPVVALGVNGDPGIEFDIDRRIALVASVNLSAGLSPRAPLTQMPRASEAEAGFISALEQDVGSIAPEELVGSCGVEVLCFFARTFAGRKARVLAHEAPVGVGYLVAEVV